MLGMPWGRFTVVNVISSIIWAAAHILPGMLLGAWLESIGLSLEMVIVVGSIVFVALILLIHYWKRIVLLFAPLMGEFGKSLQARWQKPKTDTPPS